MEYSTPQYIIHSRNLVSAIQDYERANKDKPIIRVKSYLELFKSKGLFAETLQPLFDELDKVQSKLLNDTLNQIADNRSIKEQFPYLCE